MKDTHCNNGMSQSQPASGPSTAQPQRTGPPPPTSQPMPWGMMPTGQAPSGARSAFGGTPPAVGAALFGAAPASTGDQWPGAAAAASAAATATAAAPVPLPAAGSYAPRPQPPPQAPTPTHEWAAQPEAIQVAAMQQQASGVAAAVQQMYPLHVITRFSLKVGGHRTAHGRCSSALRRPVLRVTDSALLACACLFPTSTVLHPCCPIPCRSDFWRQSRPPASPAARPASGGAAR